MHDAAVARCLALSRQARAQQSGGLGTSLADTLANLEAALEQLATHGVDAA
jgi:hypothetical protein